VGKVLNHDLPIAIFRSKSQHPEEELVVLTAFSQLRSSVLTWQLCLHWIHITAGYTNQRDALGWFHLATAAASPDLVLGAAPNLASKQASSQKSRKVSAVQTAPDAACARPIASAAGRRAGRFSECPLAQQLSLCLSAVGRLGPDEANALVAELVARTGSCADARDSCLGMHLVTLQKLVAEHAERSQTSGPSSSHPHVRARGRDALPDDAVDVVEDGSPARITGAGPFWEAGKELHDCEHNVAQPEVTEKRRPSQAVSNSSAVPESYVQGPERQPRSLRSGVESTLASGNGDMLPASAGDAHINLLKDCAQPHRSRVWPVQLTPSSCCKRGGGFHTASPASQTQLGHMQQSQASEEMPKFKHAMLSKAFQLPVPERSCPAEDTLQAASPNEQCSDHRDKCKGAEPRGRAQPAARDHDAAQAHIKPGQDELRRGGASMVQPGLHRQEDIVAAGLKAPAGEAAATADSQAPGACVAGSRSESRPPQQKPSRPPRVSKFQGKRSRGMLQLQQAHVDGTVGAIPYESISV
jgi:hypothetical protein